MGRRKFNWFWKSREKARRQSYVGCRRANRRMMHEIEKRDGYGGGAMSPTLKGKP